MNEGTNKLLYDIILEFIKSNSTYVVMYIIFLIVIPVKEIFVPHLFGKIFKAFEAKADVASITIAAIIAWGVVNFLIAFMEWYDVHFYLAMMQLVRWKSLDWLFYSYKRNYEEMKTSDMLIKMLKLPQHTYRFLDIWKKTFIPLVITFTVAFFYIAASDVYMGIVLMVVVVIYLYVVVTSPSVCGDISQLKDRTNNELNEQTEDSLRNMMAVLNAQNEEFEIDRIKSYNIAYLDEHRKTMMCIVKLQMMLAPGQFAFIIFAVWRCYILMMDGRIDTGRCISILIILLYLSNSLNKLALETREMVFMHGVIKESLSIFDRPVPSIPSLDASDAKAVEAFDIFVDNIAYRYEGTARDIFNDVTLGIRPGEKVLIEGRIGSGKSTLLKLFMRYKPFTKGMIYLGGKPYTELSIEDVRSKIGYVPQATALFDRSIYENIIYGSEGVFAIEEIYDLIEAHGLSHIFEKFEDGLMSGAGKNGSRLSGGQRQIVWILRVLLQDPEILLLDEPTASIDENTRDTINQLLYNLMGTRTVVMVTHDRNLEERASRIITLNDGMVVRDIQNS